ncbi:MULTISPECIES: hypothetical protein [unclassified Streptomyces]|uniref:hypothetical protein n=1 Tax=unclassified Streptomyces TaxID=2593676 RepID=UPI000DBA8752|nr:MULTISPECIES: hypothetical protein [unclassified Streptomyces]MYT69171.1 hypothetical protein [Streptomyces sp. SID8367]RAJ82686.1 hypothetical protein K377_04407 [Streptomyces sp. PsTaAH-137]
MPDHNTSERPVQKAGEARVLIVGATRILRPAVAALSERAVSVTAVARSAADLRELADEHPGRVTPLAADVTAQDFGSVLRGAAERAPLTGAVVYAPAVPPGTLAELVGSVVAGPVVVLATSEWAAPDDSGTGAGADTWSPNDLPAAPRSGSASRFLVLGWHGEGQVTRWHTPHEISTAALALLDAPADGDTVLGTARPWSSRPR